MSFGKNSNLQAVQLQKLTANQNFVKVRLGEQCQNVLIFHYLDGNLAVCSDLITSEVRYVNKNTLVHILDY